MRTPTYSVPRPRARRFRGWHAALIFVAANALGVLPGHLWLATLGLLVSRSAGVVLIGAVFLAFALVQGLASPWTARLAMDTRPPSELEATHQAPSRDIASGPTPQPGCDSSVTAWVTGS